MTRRLLVGGMLTLVGAVTMALGPTTMARADGPDQITLTGDVLAEPLTVSAEDNPELFTSLYREVDWLIGRTSQAMKPDHEALGPQIVLVVHVDGKARYRFNLYPLAEGGPRAHRPGSQPGDREVRSGWFYGRLSMPETIASAGVPLTAGALSGGVGGGHTTTDHAATPGLSEVLDEWREGMRITAAVTVVIVLGLGAVAVLIRRKV